MSKIEVNEIVPQSGTTLTLGGSGDTLSIASGVTSSFPSLTVSGDLTVDTNTLYVDSANNRVGIGTTSPDNKLHIQNGDASASSNAYSNLTIESSSSINVLQFLSPNTAQQQIRFGDPQDDGNGYIAYNHSGVHLSFGVNGPEKMRIDSSGNVLVGTTASTDPATNNVGSGIRLADTGRVSASATSTQALNLNRTTDDGDIAIFRKDGTSVGSIGVDSSDNFYIGATTASHAGLYMWSNGVTPMIAGSQTDDTVNLGRDIYRWKNLYMGGNIYLGGTGSANALDDYEEGTFTPTVSSSNDDSSVTYSVQDGYYSKVGNQVSFSIRVQPSISNNGTGSFIEIRGLPFAYSGNRIGVSIGGVNGINALAQDANAHGLQAIILSGQSHIKLTYYRLQGSNGNYVNPATAGLPSYIVLGGTYTTTT